jgi:hypothetical protein
MAKKYVSRCRVTRNGARVTDLKNFKWAEDVYRSKIMTQDGPGTVDLPDGPAFTIDYVVPKTDAKLNWRDVEDETWVVELQGGKRVIFTGVDCLKRGEAPVDGEKETVMTLEFAATTATIQ